MKISTILSELDNNQEYREALYKHFHQNPELSLQEFKTADRLESELRRLVSTRYCASVRPASSLHPPG